MIDHLFAYVRIRCQCHALDVLRSSGISIAYLLLNSHYRLSTFVKMAPIPDTFGEETRNLISSLERRQRDIIDFQIPRLRSCKGPLSIQQNLSAELREDTNRLNQQIEVCFNTLFQSWFKDLNFFTSGTGCVSG